MFDNFNISHTIHLLLQNTAKWGATCAPEDTDGECLNHLSSRYRNVSIDDELLPSNYFEDSKSYEFKNKLSWTTFR